MQSWQQSYSPLQKLSKNIIKAQNNTSLKTVILKKISFSSVSPKKKEHIVNEVNTLIKMDYIHLLKYLDFQINKKDLTVDIAMQYCEGGNLQDLILKHRTEGRKIEENLIWRIFYQLVQALDHIHEDNIIHRNIDPSNIYFKENKKVNIKLGGFSVAKKINIEDTLESTVLPNTYYFSPQQIQTGICTKQTDIWALGCLLYELCDLKSPFMHPNSFEKAKMIKEMRPKKLPYYSTQLNRLIFWCIDKTPNNRPTLIKLRSAPKIILQIKDRRYQEQKAQLDRREIELQKKEKQIQEKQNQMKREQKLLQRFESLRKRSSEISIPHHTYLKHST